MRNVYEFADFLNKKKFNDDNFNFNFDDFQENDYIEKLKEFKEEKENYDNDNDISEDNKNNSDKIFCCQALKKKERLRKVKEIFEKNKLKLQKKYEYCNLYVKNLHKNISEETFREMFSQFGPLKSCKLLEKKFRISLFDKNETTFLYGFVCFENEKDALNAKKAWNKSLINSSFRKTLYVDYHQFKKEREITLRNKRINFINRLEKEKRNFININNNNNYINVHNPDIHQKILTPNTKINFTYKSPICNLLQNFNGAYSIINQGTGFFNNNNTNRED